MNILFVEDDRRVAEAMIDELEDAGHAVAWHRRVVDTRGLGLDNFDAFLFDVDLGPGETGLELARRVRSALPCAHIVLWSGNDYSIEAKAIGCAFVTKDWGAIGRALAALNGPPNA